jgi:hypothetical protein
MAQMEEMDMGMPDMSDMVRDSGSGTAWQPEDTPMYLLHATKGSWMLMFHENAFLQYVHESGARGADQAGSINWAMAMAQRDLGSGRVGFRGMLSAEPWTIPGCGYPDVLQTGEQCQGGRIHDRQHPHNLFMEVSAAYDTRLAGNVRWQVYGGPAGEPALGPVAFPHRLSAMPNPLAPITHHWFDSTHITFGVVTGGVYGKRWKAEGSVFNGREPDEHRAGFEFAPLNAASGRFWLLPTSHLALQVSAGHLPEAEASPTGGPRNDVNRVTASATYHRSLGERGIWATMVGWGRNSELGHVSNALLWETSWTRDQRHTLFGRFEAVGKPAQDLVVPEPPDAFTVTKLQGGYSRYMSAWKGFQPGLGAGLGLGIVPASLTATYGSRTNIEFAVFLTLRPAVMEHAMGPTPMEEKEFLQGGDASSSHRTEVAQHTGGLK